MNKIEESIQAVCVAWFRSHYGDDYELVMINNEGKRTQAQRARLSRMGLCKGASDIFLVLNGKVVFVEFKTPPTQTYNPKTKRMNKKAGGKQSPEQKAFQNKVEKNNHTYLLIDDFHEFVKVVKNLLTS